MKFSFYSILAGVCFSCIVIGQPRVGAAIYFGTIAALWSIDESIKGGRRQ